MKETGLEMELQIGLHGGNSLVPTNEFSSCNVRFRAVDNTGNMSAWSSAVHIHQDTEAPTFVTWWFGTVNTDIIQLYIQANDNVEIGKIQISTSTEKGEGNNWILVDAVWDASANAYRADIYPSSWGHYGTTYYTHLYIYDNAGNGGYYAQTSTYIETIKWEDIASLGTGNPARVWDGNKSNFGPFGGYIGNLTDSDVGNVTEYDYTKFTYSTSYTFNGAKSISGVTITMPSRDTAMGYLDDGIIYFEKTYQAVAYVYVDDVLCGSVTVAHNTYQTDFVCDFGKYVLGNTVKVVFSRNTYAEKGGQYYYQVGMNKYGAQFLVLVNEITPIF